MAMGGMAMSAGKGYKAGGMMPQGYKAGGCVRGDGICKKGRTKGRMV